MKAVKITIIVCASVAVAFLVAFFCVLCVYNGAKAATTHRYSDYSAQSDIVGEIEVEFNGKNWNENSVYVDGTQIKTFKAGNASKVFEHGEKSYALAILRNGGALYGYLYEYSASGTVFVEKLTFSKES